VLIAAVIVRALDIWYEVMFVESLGPCTRLQPDTSASLTLCGQIQFVAAVTVAVIAFVGLAVVNRLEEIPDRLDQLAAGAERAPEPPS